MRLILTLIFITGCASSVQRQEAPEYKISSALYQTHRIPFRTSPRTLEMALPEAPVRNFLDQVSAERGDEFQRSKDFTVPVVSPREMTALLKKMKKEEIDSIARSLHIQNSRFNVRCLGSRPTGASEDIFLVLDSDDLKRIRLEILEVFRLRGGDRRDFVATDYTPLIPLNSTATSLEELNQKSEKDCRESVRATPAFDDKGPVLNSEQVI